jgi:transposase
MEKIDLRTLSEAELLGIRKFAVHQVQLGKSQKLVCSEIGLRPNTLSEWYKDFKEKGIKGLKSEKKGARSEPMKLLNSTREKAIRKMIIDKFPEQLKLDFALWTRKAVKELIEQQYSIDIAIRTVGAYLKNWGFTPQKPKKKAYEEDDKKVQKWLEEEYPSIQKLAKEQDAEIHWGDECGVRNQCKQGRSYAPKGKTPVKMGISKRFSVNMISSITNQGKVQFMIYRDSMNADKFVEFLEHLTKSSEKKIFFMVDNLRVHHSKIVKEWVLKNKENIALFYLPSYSPERSLDEYLHGDLKQ